MKLEVHQLHEEDVRKGFIRIDEETRNKLPSGKVIILELNDKRVYRRIIGVSERYKNTSSRIYLDEPTRNELGLFEQDLGKKYNFKIIYKTNYLDEFRYYFFHPDQDIKFASRISIFAILVSLIPLLISFLKYFFKFLLELIKLMFI